MMYKNVNSFPLMKVSMLRKRRSCIGRKWT